MHRAIPLLRQYVFVSRFLIMQWIRLYCVVLR